MQKNLIPKAKEVLKNHDIPKSKALTLSRFTPGRQEEIAAKIESGEAKTIETANSQIKKANNPEEIPLEIKRFKERVDKLLDYLLVCCKESPETWFKGMDNIEVVIFARVELFLALKSKLIIKFGV